MRLEYVATSQNSMRSIIFSKLRVRSKSFASLPYEHDQSDESGDTHRQPEVAPSKYCPIDHSRQNGSEGENGSRQSGQYESAHDGLFSGCRFRECLKIYKRALNSSDFARFNIRAHAARLFRERDS